MGFLTAIGKGLRSAFKVAREVRSSAVAVTDSVISLGTQIATSVGIVDSATASSFLSSYSDVRGRVSKVCDVVLASKAVSTLLEGDDTDKITDGVNLPGISGNSTLTAVTLNLPTTLARARAIAPRTGFVASVPEPTSRATNATSEKLGQVIDNCLHVVQRLDPRRYICRNELYGFESASNWIIEQKLVIDYDDTDQDVMITAANLGTIEPQSVTDVQAGARYLPTLEQPDLKGDLYKWTFQVSYADASADGLDGSSMPKTQVQLRFNRADGSTSDLTFSSTAGVLAPVIHVDYAPNIALRDLHSIYLKGDGTALAADKQVILNIRMIGIPRKTLVPVGRISYTDNDGNEAFINKGSVWWDVYGDVSADQYTDPNFNVQNLFYQTMSGYQQEVAASIQAVNTFCTSKLGVSLVAAGSEKLGEDLEIEDFIMTGWLLNAREVFDDYDQTLQLYAMILNSLESAADGAVMSDSLSLALSAAIEG